MVEGKEKFALWITPEAKKSVESHYKNDNCKSKSEYIEKTIQFYSGYLDTEHADEYLPRVLADVLEGKLGALGKRMGHLLFKLSVTKISWGISWLPTWRSTRISCGKPAFGASKR